MAEESDFNQLSRETDTGRLLRRNRELAILNTIAEALNRSVDLEQALLSQQVFIGHADMIHPIGQQRIIWQALASSRHLTQEDVALYNQPDQGYTVNKYPCWTYGEYTEQRRSRCEPSFNARRNGLLNSGNLAAPAS